ncbi:MAG: hypothetical protein K2L77_05390, partial [Muribaculaceae bacterium]|nr:hypothetical protein [Muribaculaceae bacterium]
LIAPTDRRYISPDIASFSYSGTLQYKAHETATYSIHLATDGGGGNINHRAATAARHRHRPIAT